MCINYDVIPERLQEYRKRLELTQQEMADLFSVSQSEYNRLENGKYVISYERLKAFLNNGGDIYYLFTGQRYQTGIFDYYLERCKNSWEKAQILKLLVWTLELGLHKENISLKESINALWKYVLFAENEYSTNNVWKTIRKAEDKSQAVMAEVLQINVKRYRRFEREQQLPDAYILLTLYQQLGYSPMLFLENKLCFPDLINQIWDMFSEKKQKELRNILDEGLSLL
ncbi:MAG: helix-turn-helix domain-containing protein [Lachnospiraceae bacterium]